MKVSIKEKAGTYIRYFGHSVKVRFNWMINGVVYILAGRPPKRDMYVNQGMGKIYCRQDIPLILCMLTVGMNIRLND